MFQWQTPYSFISSGLWPFNTHTLYFEDSPLMSTSSRSDAKRVAAALNGAYNLGFSAGHTMTMAELKNALTVPGENHGTSQS